MFADLISFSRILLAYPLYKVLVSHDHVAALALVAWMIISDMIDGGIARYYGVSHYGKWLDPLADAVAITAAVWAFFHLGFIGWFWIVFWIIRYAFFLFFALWVLYKDGYCIVACLWSKISIGVLLVFLCQVWYMHTTSVAVGAVVVVVQLLSMWQTLHRASR